MTNKIRIAIVGTGYFSKFHFDAWIRLDVNIVAICSLNKNEAIYYSQKLNNCPIYSNFKKMINEKKTIYNLKVDMRTNKFDSGNELKKIDLNLLPSYISNNKNKFSDWIED